MASRHDVDDSELAVRRDEGLGPAALRKNGSPVAFILTNLVKAPESPDQSLLLRPA